MALIGIIPTIADDDSPVLANPFAAELVPVGSQTVDGTMYYKPLVQLAVEGMILAGVEQLWIALTEHKPDILRFFRDGYQFGIPVSYVCPRHRNLAWAVNACYPYIMGQQVVMALPGITDPLSISHVHTARKDSGSALAMSVSQNTAVDNQTYVRKVTAHQMTGVYAWDHRFTEFMRERVVEQDDPDIQLGDVIDFALFAGMKIRAVKLPFTPFVNGCEAWSRVCLPRPVQMRMGPF